MRSGIPGWIGMAAALAACSGRDGREPEGPAPDAPRPMVLVYGTSLQGEIEPCG